jgi:hypothetical protein
MKKRIGGARGWITLRWNLLPIVAVSASVALAAWLLGSAQFSGPASADLPPLTIAKGCSPAEVVVGEEVTYTYVINNNSDLIVAGSVTLQRDSVVDTLLGDLTTDFPAILEPGDSVTVEENRVVLQSDPDPLFNSVIATYQNLTFGGTEVTQASCLVRIVGFIVVRKLDANGFLWTTPAVNFEICPGIVPDCTRDITTVTVGNGNPNPSAPIPKVPGVYTVCEEVPDGFTVLPSECQTVTVTTNQTVTVTFTNVGPPPDGSQLTPTDTDCNDFRGGTAPDLDELQYDVRRGNLSGVQPGVFFYFTKVEISSTVDTADEVTIGQSNDSGGLFDEFKIKDAVVYFDPSCNPLSKNSQPNCKGLTDCAFEIGQTGDFIIRVRYESKSIAGAAVCPLPLETSNYVFSTLVDGVLTTSDDINLVPKANAHC